MDIARNIIHIDIGIASWVFLGDEYPSYQAAWIILGIISSLQEAGPRLATTCQGKAGEFDRKIKAWLLKR
jgi:hypothetical protein